MARIRATEKEEVRRRLLKTAAEHFAQRGLESASMDAIALAAGYAKGTIYNYFDSKVQLFGEVLTEAARLAVQRYSVAAQQGSVRERLKSLAAADVAVLREEEGFMKVMVREAMSFKPETYPIIVEHLAPYVSKVEQVLADGVASKQIRRDRPTPELALVFVGILVILYVQHWGSGGAWPDLEQLPELAVTLFLDGAARPMPRQRRGPRS